MGQYQKEMETLKLNDHGEEVADLQHLLRDTGFFPGKEGIFDEQTRDAILKFQFWNGLVIDGIAGPKTWRALKRAQPAAAILQQGGRGDNLRYLQELLGKAGHRLAIDGIYGPETRNAVKKFQKKHRLITDGIAGPKTMATLFEATAIKEQTRAKKKTKTKQDIKEDDTIRTTGNPKNDEKIRSLHPLVRKRFAEFIIRAENELNIRLRVVSAYRSINEKDFLYASGRTRPGKVITHARGGRSYHNYGLATDVVEIRNGKALWKNPRWEKIGALGKSMGLEWGGDWTSIRDLPHFQYSFGKSTKKLYKLYREGKRKGIYVILKN